MSGVTEDLELLLAAAREAGEAALAYFGKQPRMAEVQVDRQ